ncbi:formate dehydrogenase accessory sulfurtransferase FdhD [Occultella glacieicola]|uniref:Sulfur carrier protein FdhD n=1 Tax=Occultella glacieicola TaxID=2518684 RepID=A0ABY2E343_9MICO|nr:formate dehydrogenase accessory sulfurtransferase FdhD [Occultella glacieicola]TDE94048.1 formate dehydrogenase accessory sulfurtransferase FdhD [Occultella glacieicola]
MTRATKRSRVRTLLADGTTRVRTDTLAGEEPMELRVDGHSLSVTMRTPGHDFDLAAGFLVSEGVLHHPQQVTRIGYGPGVDAGGAATYNIVDVTLAPGVPRPAARAERRVYTSSSCGICGTNSIEALGRVSHFEGAAHASAVFDLTVLLDLPARLRAEQAMFARTGGTHAAGLFSVSGDLLCLREDVGRHNAVDKVVGWAWRENRLPLRNTILQVSGRASFELVQKAQMAGIPALAAVSAPSSLAVELAEEAGLTLIGFSRTDRLNVYSHAERIRSSTEQRTQPTSA